jgi:NitT/TauT family transport system substrate-binding protein
LLVASLAGAASAADTVRVGKAQGSAWTFTPVDVGIDQGIFAKYGVELDVANLAGDAKVQQALVSGSIDIGLGSGPGLAFIAKGSPGIGVASFAGAPRNISAIVLVDSPIKTVAGLKGRLIAVSTVGSLSDWLAKQMAAQEGWGADGIRTVPLGAIESSVAALKARQVDAVVLGTEAGFQLEDRQEGRILFGLDKYAPHFITHVVFAQKQLVQSNPALVERFLKGFFASIAFIKANKEKSSLVAQRVLNLNAAVVGRIYDTEAQMLQDDGSFDPQAVAALKQSFVEMGTLDAKPDDKDIFTTQFLPVKP